MHLLTWLDSPDVEADRATPEAVRHARWADLMATAVKLSRSRPGCIAALTPGEQHESWAANHAVRLSKDAVLCCYCGAVACPVAAAA